MIIVIIVGGIGILFHKNLVYISYFMTAWDVYTMNVWIF